MFPLLNANKAVLEREERGKREGVGRDREAERNRERERKHGIGARMSLPPESRGPNLAPE